MENTTHESIYTIDYILTQIAKIQQQTEHLNQAIEHLSAIPPSQVPGDVASQAKATAIADVVKARETTNQQMLSLYGKMYEDLNPNKKVESKLEEMKIDALRALASVAYNEDDFASERAEMLESIRAIFRDNF